jgi:C-type lysozyme/alpha-lactalbumin family
MRLFIFTLLLIVLSFQLVSTKIFDQCEFAVELNEKHEIPKEEIYKHLCIVSEIHTSRNFDGHLGVYRIGSRWWCAQDAPGGSCNVTCASLLDEDIADDVACANLILSQQGVEGFGRVLSSCKRTFQNKTDECIKEDEENEELFESLQNFPIEFSTTERSKTTFQDFSTTFRAQPIFTRQTTTTEKPFVSEATQKVLNEKQKEYDEDSDVIIWVIAFLMIVVLLIFFIVKHKPLMNTRVSSERNQGFENLMSNL